MKCKTYFFRFTVNALFRVIPPIANGTASTAADIRIAAYGKGRDAWKKIKHKKWPHINIWNANANANDMQTMQNKHAFHVHGTNQNKNKNQIESCGM